MAAIFLEPGSSLYYFTGVRWGRSERMFGLVLPARGEPVYIVPGFEEDRAREVIPAGNEVRVWQEDENPEAKAVEALRDRGIRTGRIGIEENVRFFLFDGLRKAGATLQFTSADPVTSGCRRIKSAAELAILQRANEIDLAGVRTACRTLHEGLAHTEFADSCEAEIRKLGSTRADVTVTFGKQTASPHGSIRPQKLQEGDVVLIDAVCDLLGYQADITRTLVYGKPTARQRSIWELERRAQDAALQAVRPGATCESIDAAARNILVAAGFGPDYRLPGLPHRTGHGVGLDVHEWPYLVRGNKTKLEPGMCFSDEPMIVLPGEFGIRLEDCFHVTEEGAKTFTPQSESIGQPI